MIPRALYEDVIFDAIRKGSTEIAPDVLAAFERAIARESRPAAKEGLLKKAIGTEEVPVIVTDEKVSFPWFSEGIPAEDCMAYTKLIGAICRMAKEAKRVTAREKETDNPKYAFRCFLLRLGFIGDEYKADRKILLRNLSGSSAFRAGKKA